MYVKREIPVFKHSPNYWSKHASGNFYTYSTPKRNLLITHKKYNKEKIEIPW